MADIEYFYSAHSAFAYLGSARLMQLAEAAGRRILHKPVDLRRVILVAGAGLIEGRTQAHRDYFFRREIERWAEARDAPVMDGVPTHHRKDMTLPNCMLIAALLRGENVDRLAHVMLEAHWRDDADLADSVTLTRLGESVGHDPGPLLAASETPEVRACYEANTEEAIARSVFGSPTYFVDGDMFYGQDRLEVVARAMERPFSGAFAIET